MPRTSIPPYSAQPPMQQPQPQQAPYRKASGFTPAARMGSTAPSPPPTGRTFAPPEMPEGEEAEIELVESRQSQQPPSQSIQPLTRSGYPDRRYRGQRELPPAETTTQFTRARQGGMAGDIHVTLEGKPDRRFKENRNLSEDEAMRVWLEQMNERYGVRRR